MGKTWNNLVNWSPWIIARHFEADQNKVSVIFNQSFELEPWQSYVACGERNPVQCVIEKKRSMAEGIFFNIINGIRFSPFAGQHNHDDIVA